MKKIICLIVAMALFFVIVPGTAGATEPNYELREFPNVGILDVWLKNDDVSENKYVKGEYDCKDFTQDLCDAAWRDGYKMYPLFIKDCKGKIYHVTCVVPIKKQNAYYQIRPQTDVISKLCPMD